MGERDKERVEGKRERERETAGDSGRQREREKQRKIERGRKRDREQERDVYRLRGGEEKKMREKEERMKEGERMY